MNLPPHAAHPPHLNPPERELLDELERRTFRYFLDRAHPKTGLVQDRAANFGTDAYHVASMAATGFGLAALVIGTERGYISRDEAYRRALRTLKFAAQMPREHGWFYHFVEWDTGERSWKCELSSIDTALFMMGVLAAGEYFRGTEAEALAQKLYRAVDFNWMRTDGGAKPNELTLSMGWKPEDGFIASRWGGYSEHTFLYLLALSSPAHPVPAESWTAWERVRGKIGPYEALGIRHPLFVHQYLHCWVDVKGKVDSRGDDFWENSVAATRANRWFCMYRADFPGFGPTGWGLNAVDGPDGYRAYEPVPGNPDGTLSPIGVAAALPFIPKEGMETLMAMKKEHGERIWGKYGFSSYNLKRDWRGDDMVGIDAGAALLMIDRYRTGGALIPGLIERAALHTGLKRAGFHRKEVGKG
jgi:hypothetical protein